MGVAETASKPESLTMELIIGLVASSIFTLLVAVALAWLYWGRANPSCAGSDCRQQTPAVASQPPRDFAPPLAQPAADTPQVGVGAQGWPLVLPKQAPVVAAGEDISRVPVDVPVPQPTSKEAGDQERLQSRVGVTPPWSAAAVTRAGRDANADANARPITSMRRPTLGLAPTAKHIEVPFAGGQIPLLRPCLGQLPVEPGLVCELTRNGSQWVISLLPFSRTTGRALVRACWGGLWLIPSGCVESLVEICPTNCPITIAEALAPYPAAIAHWSPRPW